MGTWTGLGCGPSGPELSAHETGPQRTLYHTVGRKIIRALDTVHVKKIITYAIL